MSLPDNLTFKNNPSGILPVRVLRNLLRSINLLLSKAEITDLSALLDPHGLGSFHVSGLSQALTNLMGGGYDRLKLEDALKKLDLDQDGKIHVDELRYFIEMYGPAL